MRKTFDALGGKMLRTQHSGAPAAPVFLLALVLLLLSLSGCSLTRVPRLYGDQTEHSAPALSAEAIARTDALLARYGLHSIGAMGVGGASDAGIVSADYLRSRSAASKSVGLSGEGLTAHGGGVYWTHIAESASPERPAVVYFVVDANGRLVGAWGEIPYGRSPIVVPLSDPSLKTPQH